MRHVIQVTLSMFWSLVDWSINVLNIPLSLLEVPSIACRCKT